jgi:hypothetical protein
MLLINLISILLLVVISAICKAVADKIAHHFGISIFSTFKNQMFWDTRISWLNKYVNNDVKQGFKKIKILGFSFTKPIVFSDAWHLYKSSMIVTLILAICLYPVMILTGFWYVDFIILGTAWNLSFNFAYNVWLVKR